MLAVGVYLQTLRKAHGFSRAEVAHQVGTHESQIVRIESGEQDSRGSLLFALIRALKGSPEDVDFLILDKRATKENAESLAKQRLSVQAQEDALIEAADTDEKRAEWSCRSLVKELYRRRDHPMRRGLVLALTALALAG